MHTPWINEDKKVVELGEKLGVAEDQVAAAEGQVTTLKEKVASLEEEVTNLKDAAKSSKSCESTMKNLASSWKNAFDLEESSRDALKKQTIVADHLRDQIKSLENKVTTLEKQVMFDVSFYNDLFFNAIYTAWVTNDAGFTVNVGEPTVRETSRVEGYNLEHPDIPPSVSEVPLVESEETLVDVTGWPFSGGLSEWIRLSRIIVTHLPQSELRVWFTHIDDAHRLSLPHQILAQRLVPMVEPFPFYHRISTWEKHFTAGEIVRDMIIDVSDGLAIPFTLAAGLSGANATSSIVLTAGITEVAAGAINYGYLPDHYLILV
ncbi:hypothetical protein F8388_021095 [Cannabis sativa]|uniref:Uncharacterized protein n=1 Tax=Cannabis sativa TaxID=3483 RepID=A0A7J6GZI7_CANSA|nr:hypothetical protein F8388_021095 [Cannabis sativa]